MRRRRCNGFLTQIERLIPRGKREAIFPNIEESVEPDSALRICCKTCITCRTATAVAEDRRRAFSEFCGVESANQAPDGDTLGRFRIILARGGIQAGDLLLKKGMIWDSAATLSTKDRDHQRDPEGSPSQEGRRVALGLSGACGRGQGQRIGAHAQSHRRQYPRCFELLTGGEETVYGKSGFPDAEKRRDAAARSQRGRKIKYRLNRRPLPASGILFVAVGTAPGGRH